MCAIPQKIMPEGAPNRPLAQYQSPILAVCSSRFHQDDVIKTNPGFKHDSKTPRKKRATARVAKLVAPALHASVMPNAC